MQIWRPIVKYVLTTVQVPDQERQYYAGPVRQIAGRMAHQVTRLLDHATRFNTLEEADAMSKELGRDYNVVTVDAD